MRSAASLSRHRTFRWNDGRDVERYDAVETTDEGPRWYTWSHAPGREGGRRDEVSQTWAELVRDGAPRRGPRALPVPDAVLAALRAWLDEHA